MNHLLNDLYKNKTKDKKTFLSSFICFEMGIKYKAPQLLIYDSKVKKVTHFHIRINVVYRTINRANIRCSLWRTP